MCIWSTIIIDQYIWKKTIDLSIFFVWKCTWWDKAENGVGGKEIQFFLFNGIKLVKKHSDGNETLRIIWKLDLSSREVLGRIYALSIEVISPGPPPYKKRYTGKFGILFFYPTFALRRHPAPRSSAHTDTKTLL